MSDRVLVCFALPEEAGPFRRSAGRQTGIHLVVTGMGQRRAAASARTALVAVQPALVLTCGFAGGLNPALAAGDVIFDAPGPFPLGEALLAAGARPGTFHCADRIAATAAEKHELRVSTGADAVEMESAAIQAVCVEAGVPCATVRVISDAAGEDLPVDFNRFTRADQSLDLGRLVLAAACSPRLVGGLLRLRRTTRLAAERLAEVLAAAILTGR
jgi:adenosylhomocysteine nucleosidase